MRAMNRRDACRLIAATPLLGSTITACAAATERRPANALTNLPREFRGVWVATVDNIDWPSVPGLSTDAQIAEIDRTLDQCAALGLNAIFLQVRPTCDALYRSPIEPWSAFMTGRQGAGPDPDYDPLQRWVEGAHKRGIDLHAWINPFRARHPKSIGPDAIDHVSRIHPGITRSYRGHLWLDPGSPVSRELAERVIDDLLERYDIDGVHMDDYFYPYPDRDRPFPDDETFGAYQRSGGRLDRDDWRRDNINRFVASVNGLVHRKRPGGLFTISPFGIWRPGHPKQVVGFDAYAGLYADAKHWMQNGLCDALIPQLYWKIESKGQPFVPLMDWWADQNTLRRHLWAGLYLTRIKPGDDTESPSWEPGEILDQIRLVSEERRVSGYTLFSMIGMLENRRGVTDLLRAGPLSSPALVPESPWLNAPRPGVPRCEAQRDGRAIRLSVTPAPGQPPTRRIAVTLSGRGTPDRHWILTGGSDTVRATLKPGEIPAGASLTVTPIGANGAAGSPAPLAF